MATLEERIKASTRRGSAIAIQSNPIETGVSEKAAIKVENLSECRIITPPETDAILEKLKACENNETILNTLESEKLPYLISSDSLVKLLTCTTSVKTRLTMILNVAPRLSDPRAKMSTFTDMFRFSEEKTQIEDAFKARIQAMNGSMFRRETSNMLSPAGRGGRGRGAALSPGRGDFGGGRGAGALLTNKPRAVSLPVGQKFELPADGVGSQRSTDKDSDDDDDDDNGQCPASSHRPFSMVITPTVFNKVEETGALSAAADSKN